MDHGFGLIINVLKTRGIEDNTSAFCWATTVRRYFGARVLSLTVTGVPLIIRWPDRVPPKSNLLRSSAVQIGQQFFPRGIKKLKEMTGVSF